MTDERRAQVYAGLTVLCWATVATAFKLGLRYVDPWQLLWLATLTAAMVLGLAVGLTGRWPELRRSTARQWRVSLLAGLLNPCLYYALLLTAYNRLPAQEAQPLNMIWPVVLALLAAPVRGHPLGWRELTGLLVCCFGVLHISTGGHPASFRPTDPLGVALAVGSSLPWSIYWLLNVADERDELVKLCAAFGLAVIPVTVLTAACSDLTRPPWPGLAAGLWVGLFEMGLTFVLWLKALALTTNTARLGRLLYLFPGLSLLLIHLVLGESIRPATITGLLLILGGVALGGRRG